MYRVIGHLFYANKKEGEDQFATVDVDATSNTHI